VKSVSKNRIYSDRWINPVDHSLGNPDLRFGTPFGEFPHPMRISLLS